MNQAFMPGRNTRTYPSRSLHGSIVHELGTRIATGIYASGSTLPVEEALREELSVSRNALREAVKVLSAKGLLKVKTRTGTQVQPREKWHLTDPDVLAWAMSGDIDAEALEWLTEFRRIIEPSAAEFAAVRASSSERESIRRCMEALQAADEQIDAGEMTLEAYAEVDVAFHEAIFVAAGNPFLQNVATSISSALNRSRRVSDSIPGARKRSFPIHMDIGQSVIDGRPKEAREAMLKLFDYLSEDLKRAFES